MKRYVTLIFVFLMLLTMTGCWDGTELEEQSISLTYGFDVSENNQLLMYNVSPVFDKNADQSYEVYEKKAVTPRESKEQFNSSSPLVVTGKIQTMLFSHKLLKKDGIMPYLDVWYRDPKDTGNTRIVAVKGSVSSILNSEFKNKPMLPAYLTDIINVNKQYNRTAYTTLQDLHRQLFDKGITPFISEIKKGDKDLIVTGTALLTNKGFYKMSLNRQESALLLMLQKDAKMPVSLTIRVPSKSFETQYSLRNVRGSGFITINVISMKQKIRTKYAKGQFAFDVNMKLNASLAERTFNMNMKKDQEKLDTLLAKQLSYDLNTLIQKVQRQQLDPFGFGDYARAFQYQHWKKVENNWSTTFSEATVKVKPTVRILDHGIIE
ncbi:Ger(x)C family spore germination protein [Priestia megaterium]|uniref:Ger(x)C family spore germination protein n=1 Tax=Priestia megaterium TaxID=1404 RepID=UPI00273203C0|nr:Ger(x)C family spore germination protein [Priestia megaterium]MDP1442246.1 Ger(x)C family spore germination protein [Priestia megaterium]MDP1471164.1 Ger(x)C family spore germination protein [Priestia megaterium]